MICIPNFRHIHPAVGERNYQIIGSFSFVFDIVKGSFTVIQPCAALFEIAPQLKIFDIQSNLRTGRRQRQNRRAVCIFTDGKYAFGIIVENVTAHTAAQYIDRYHIKTPHLRAFALYHISARG